MPVLTGKASRVSYQAILDDFRYMNPNDPGAWPAIPKVTVLIGVFLVILLAGWWFFWSDQLALLEGAGQEELSLKDQYIAKKRQAVNLDLYTQQLAEIDRSFGALLKQLPNKSEIEALLIEVNQAGLGRGLQFELFRPGAEQIKDFYAELPVTVKINGSYHDIGAFAADVAKLPRIVTLNSVAIAPLKNSETLSLDATVKTFRYLDEEELAEQKRAEEKLKADQAKGGGK
ncbi:type 4a pilus biogenesis protein PilO [Azonexus sp.]|uniref:type 4a pilus biogenesis protein PilO n=1 Tax=Azonexus sp. TaxID=1872668 RepID=UPI0035B059BF